MDPGTKLAKDQIIQTKKTIAYYPWYVFYSQVASFDSIFFSSLKLKT